MDGSQNRSAREPAAGTLTSNRPAYGLRLAAWVVLALLLGFCGWKGMRLVQLALAVRAEVAQLQALAQAPSLPAAAQAGPLIARSRRDVAALRAETQPFLWLTPGLAWVPVYGADLKAAGPLLDLASGLTQAADEAYAGLVPLLSAVSAQEKRPTPEQALALLTAARPRLEAAQTAAEAALAARALIQPASLSPRTRRLVDRVDGVLPLLRPGLALALAAPDLLGAQTPRTYLILIQNQDELRPTGGFISAVGAVTVARGQIQALQIDDYPAADDFSLRYPLPPEPLQRYMGTTLWLVRDANWSPDYPSSAALADALYTAAHPQSTDGVIALNQSALRVMLEVVGPLSLPDAPEPVTADNVEGYMWAAWSPAPGQGTSAAWWQHRKDFMPRLASAVLDRLPAADLSAAASAARQVLDERAVLIWLKEPRAAAALAELGWDGALRPGEGDYLMVVDANVGFNKVNAIVQTQITYTVDLSSPQGPTGAVAVAHFNPAQGALPCRQTGNYGAGNGQDTISSYKDLTQRCYWDYLRVYQPQGAVLQSASLQDIPGEWMLSGEAVTGTVDVGVDSGGAQSFGTLTVVPFGQHQTTAFAYRLPPGLVQTAAGRSTYHLHVQKQPGTPAVPLYLQVQLPSGARLVSATPAGKLAGNLWQWETHLAQDIDVQLVFEEP